MVMLIIFFQTGFFWVSPGFYILFNFVVILALIKYYIVYGMFGFLTFNEWKDHLLTLDVKLADDFIRGVSFPVHMAYFNVQSIFGAKFHLIDLPQNTLFYFWVVPGMRFATNILYQLVIEFLLPLEFYEFLMWPHSLIDMDEYNYSGRMKPKDGLPKLLAQMWDYQRLLWFDETFLRDPLGYDTELTSETFIGLFCT